ncbi:MAG: oligosaccharide flippase family protein [Anaerococcus sp.]|nr:oligosaccharide flippase family protein [Anaerococcus sp.]
MKLNQKKMGAFLSYVSILLLTLITMVYTPIVLKYLGKSEYGVYNLTISIVSYLSLLSLGFGGSYVKFYYQFKVRNKFEDIEKLNGLFMLVYMIMGAVSIIVGIILVDNIDTLLQGKMSISEIALSKSLMIILIINIFLTFPATVFEAYITANEEFIFQKILMLFRQISSPLLSIPLLIIGYRSLALVIITTIITFLSLIANMVFAVKKLGMKFSFKDPDLRLLKDIAIFSSFLFLNVITDQINWSIDKFVLGKFVGSVSITIYSMGAIINSMYINVSTSVSSVFIPQANDIIQRNSSDSQISDFFIKIGRLQYYILMLILLGFITFGSYFISEIWLDATYKSSYYVSIILIIPVTIASIQNIGIEIQKAKNLHKFRSILYFMIAIANLFISIPLAIKFGPIGSAIGTGITLLIGSGLIMNIYYKRVVGLDIRRFWMNILYISRGIVVPIIISLIFLITKVSSHFDFLIKVIIFIAIYVISIYIASMNDFEKLEVNKLLKRVKG